VAGHDWGAIIGWCLCLFRPDRVKGFISLSVPYFPRDPKLKPSDFFKIFGDGLYITQFQVKPKFTFKIYDVSVTIMVLIVVVDSISRFCFLQETRKS